ncbi:MAG: hypothetical protein GXP30_13005 [Verrucomicrobia bacterium]|nr:hypothetical protein [Verrucomicrobiota bacterium]
MTDSDHDSTGATRDAYEGRGFKLSGLLSLRLARSKVSIEQTARCIVSVVDLHLPRLPIVKGCSG